MKIVEHRGHDINYIVFIGSYDDCQTWMALNTKEHPNNDAIRISIDNNNVNGNREPFTYTIEVED